jgi:hypothetical protein
LETKPAAPNKAPPIAIPSVKMAGLARDVNVNEALPYTVRWYRVADLRARQHGKPVGGVAKERRFQHGRDALAFARRHWLAEVYYTSHRYETLGYAEQILVRSDKAKPPKGGMGAFCKGQTTKFVNHRVAREATTVRVY